MSYSSEEEKKAYVEANTDTKISQKLIKFSEYIIVARDNISSICKYERKILEHYVKETSHAKYFFSNNPFTINVIKLVFISISILILLYIFSDKLNINRNYNPIALFENYSKSIILFYNNSSHQEVNLYSLYNDIRNFVNDEEVPIIIPILLVLLYFYIIEIFFSVISAILGFFYDIIIGPYDKKPATRLIHAGWYVSIGLNSGEIIYKRLVSESYMNDYIKQLGELIEKKIDATQYYIVNDRGIIQNIGDSHVSSGIS